MRRYSETSNAYQGSAGMLYLVEGKKGKSVNRYIRNHIENIKEYLKRWNVPVNGFEAISPTLFGRRSLRNLLLRQCPTLTREELEKRVKELRLIKRESTSALYYITETYKTDNGEHITDIICEDNLSSEGNYEEKILMFLDSIARYHLESRQAEEVLRLGNHRYKLSDDDYGIPFYKEYDNSEFLGDELLADSISNIRSTVISPIRFDNNFNISLPLYPQITIKLEPLPKTLYILFLQHPEGIVLKNIHDYKDELKRIYQVVSGRKNPSVIERVFLRLTDPTENQLHRNLTKIRRCFMSKLNYNIANSYIPAHSRAKAHIIPLDSSLIELPEMA